MIHVVENSISKLKLNQLWNNPNKLRAYTDFVKLLYYQVVTYLKHDTNPFYIGKTIRIFLIYIIWFFKDAVLNTKDHIEIENFQQHYY